MLYRKEVVLGLAQKITLKESISVEEASQFLDWICEDLPHSKKESGWVIHSVDGKSMSFEINWFMFGYQDSLVLISSKQIPTHSHDGVVLQLL